MKTEMILFSTIFFMDSKLREYLREEASTVWPHEGEILEKSWSEITKIHDRWI